MMPPVLGPHMTVPASVLLRSNFVRVTAAMPGDAAALPEPHVVSAPLLLVGSRRNESSGLLSG